MKKNQEETLLKNLIIPFLKAWNLFFDISLSSNSETFESNKNISGENDTFVLYFIPIVGFILGLFAYFLSWIVSALGGTVLATILCPFIIVLSWELLNHAKDTAYLVNYINFKILKHYNSDSIDTENNENNFMLFYIFTALFIVRVLCLGVFIYYHYFGWIIVTAVLTYAVQGHLAAEDKKNSKEGLIAVDKKSISIMWIITAILCLLFGAVNFPIMLLAFIVSVLIAVKAKSSYEKTDSLSGANIGFTGKYTELIILLIGLLVRFNF